MDNQKQLGEAIRDKLVRFANEKDGGPVHKVVAVDRDGMVELNDMGGWFGPHLFAIADDIGGIPPSVPPDLVHLEGEDIVIRITPAALRFASENGVLASFSKLKNDFRKVSVFDIVAWRKEVLTALQREAENGDTPVHLMLDDALQWAVEQGPEGISIEGILP
jgi:hypothetical protein